MDHWEDYGKINIATVEKHGKVPNWRKVAVRVLLENRVLWIALFGAYLMPKEFEITETHLMEIPDHELDAFIEFAQTATCRACSQRCSPRSGDD